ncbi:MAG: 2Fe-2S iron-sulfur cluster binding domain-containing protein [Veillonella sp.]|nr:2Fe-2S iron-sulfur cluster binding domain-containing protein [Veillonella sp.]
MEVTLTINGKNRMVDVPEDQMLLETLRNLGYFSVRCGCDTTNCGLCTVWVDGEITLSCAYPTFRAPGHEITTLEGLEEEAKLLTDCLASEGADQCGFCTTGMMMSAIALKRRNPNATDDEIREYLIGNLCRCTGYQSQLRGVRKFLQGGQA